MNKSVIESVGEFFPPPIESYGIPINSIAINVWDDLFFLCDNGKIRYINLKKDSDSSCDTQELTITGESIISDMDIRNIQFNGCGSILMIWGKQFLGAVLLPRAYSLDGGTSPGTEGLKCELKPLWSSSDGSSIKKAMWHPLSDKHIVILTDNSKLCVIDVVQTEMQEYVLDPSTNYVSFCFGPDLDWLRLAVVLLDDEGQLSLLCPILPVGAVVPGHIVEQLSDWSQEMNALHMDYNSDEAGDSKASWESYREMVSLYLRSAFGMGSNSAPERVIRAGVRKGSSLLTPGSILFNAFFREPVLQGPFRTEGRVVTKMDGMHPCDLCVPVGKGYASTPLVLVVWNNGDIEEFLLGGQSTDDVVCNVSWYVCLLTFQVLPRWTEGKSDTLLPPLLPPLVQIETIALTEVSNESLSGVAASPSLSKDQYTLVPDPESGRNFHVVGSSSGKSFMIDLAWMEECKTNEAALDPPFHKKDTSVPEDSTAFLVFAHSTSESEEPTSPCSALAGVSIVSNPTVGHIALFRAVDGYMSAVNLTVHLRLMELEGHIRRRNEEDRIMAVEQSTSGDNDMFELQWISERLVLKARKGIETVPKMRRNDKATESECMNALIAAKQHLEENVVLPLEQLMQRTKFSEGIIRDVCEGQLDLLESKGKGEDGVVHRLESLLKRQAELKNRIIRVGENLQRQKDLAACALSVSLSTYTKISHAEKIYASQLESWKSVASRLDSSIKALERSKAYVESTTGMKGQRNLSSVRRHQSSSSRSIKLSQEENEACVQLLGAQGEILEITDNAIISLQDRIRALANSLP